MKKVVGKEEGVRISAGKWYVGKRLLLPPPLRLIRILVLILGFLLL